MLHGVPDLVEVASALHRGRIFCASLSRSLFVSSERGVALVQAYKFDSISAKAAFTDRVVMWKACNGDKADHRQREVCL